MTNQCTICAHPDRVRIETLVASGASARSVARRFALSVDATYRHMRRHVTAERRALLIAGPAARISELALRAADENEGVLEYLAALRSILFSRIAAAAESGDDNGVAVLSGRAIDVLRHLGRLAGVLGEGSVNIQNNFVINPLFTELQAMLLEVLRPYPEARAAVVGGLRQLEQRAAPPRMIEASVDDARVAP